MSTLDFEGREILAALEDQFTPVVSLKNKAKLKIHNAIVCSFFTGDDYYRNHAARLQANLEELGIAFEQRLDRRMYLPLVHQIAQANQLCAALEQRRSRPWD